MHRGPIHMEDMRPGKVKYRTPNNYINEIRTILLGQPLETSYFSLFSGANYSDLVGGPQF